tara:strand:+ start:277 stop:912 length:636 start_codon:yes stop_codon:yes gene_type:complete
MAANEHKNLLDANRHNPLGYEGAANETVLSKGEGTSAAARDGNLEWAPRSTMGVTNYKMQGYTVGTTNFQYGEDVADNKSPFIMDVDYGASTVAGGSLAPMNIFRIGQSCIAPENATLDSITGWVSSNNSTDITIAICRAIVDPSSTSNLVPTVISEFSVTGGGNNSMLVAVDIQSIGVEIAKSDIIFPMIKEAVAGSNLHMNLTLKTVTF